MGLNFEAKAADRNKQTDALAKKWATEPKRNRIMIIFSAVKLKDLFKKKRNYPWRKPEGCRLFSVRPETRIFAQSLLA
jgi:hypothetical protein